jgi:hypothetical protein
LDVAKEMVEKLRSEFKEALDRADVKRALSMVELAEKGGVGTGEAEKLEERVNNNPNDQEAR